MPRITVINIDNTLWDFADVLYERFAKANSQVLPSDSWTHRDFWKSYLKSEDFYSMVDEIHIEQDRYDVYPDPGEFVEDLYAQGYPIVIASHRRHESKTAILR